MAINTLQSPHYQDTEVAAGFQRTSFPARNSPAHMHLGTFTLFRRHDGNGVSGVGTVAEGARFSDGTVVLHWLRAHRTTRVFPSLRQVLRVHGHGGNTRVVWDARRSVVTEVQ